MMIHQRCLFGLCRLGTSKVLYRRILTRNRRYRLLNNDKFQVSYDCKRCVPRWVYEVINREDVTGPLSRRNCRIRFRADPRLGERVRTHPHDYHGHSDLSRGHIAAAGNYKSDLNVREATFLLSNIAPQNRDLNANYWMEIESDTRDLTQTAEKVHVVTGPLFIAKNEEEIQKIPSRSAHQPISVPTHFFKVVVSESAEETNTYGLVVPNAPIPSGRDRRIYATSVEKIEAFTKIRFSSIFPRKLRVNLKGVSLLPRGRTNVRRNDGTHIGRESFQRDL